MYRKRVVKILSIGLAVSLSAFALSGCSGSGNSDQSFTYWSMWKKGEPQQTVLQKSIDEFTKQTGVKVNVQWSGRNVLTQVVPRLNAGNPPDLVDQGTNDIAAALLPVNGALDLTKLYKMKIMGEDKTIADVIPPGLVDTVKDKNGHPFLVPYSLFGSAVWYSSLATPSLAQNQPATWDDFLTEMKALKAEGRTPISVEGSNPDNYGFWMWWAITRAGGAHALSEAAADKTGASFDDPAWIAATDAIAKMIDGKFFPVGYNATKDPTQQAAWADQSTKTDVMIMGTWLPSETDASLTKENLDPSKVIEYHSFPFPTISPADKGDDVAQASAIGFAIPAKALHKSAAEKFITFFMNKDQISGISTVAKNLTSRTDVTVPAELKDFGAEYAKAKAFSDFFDGIPASAPKWYTDAWLPNLTAFFEGHQSAAQFRAALKAKAIEING